MTSKVGERLNWLIGKTVHVIVAYGEQGQITSNHFKAIYHDLIPAGREYFYRFIIEGKNKLIRASSVILVEEV